MSLFEVALMRKNTVSDFYEKTMGEPNSGCLLWMGGIDPKGYGWHRARPDKERLAHRFAWRFANGDIPEGMHVLHKCDTPLCVRVDHLFLGTNADNVADKVAKCRQATCERHPSAKLAISDVRAIRASGEQKNVLAALYGVDESTIRNIRNRKYWRAVS